MSVKKDLLAEIEAKAKKIKERKIKVSRKEDVEKLVFDFFKEAELMGKMKEPALLHDALAHLRRTIQQKYDWGAQVEASWTDNHEIQGVLITWSSKHQLAHQSEQQIYIGVEQLLFS